MIRFIKLAGASALALAFVGGAMAADLTIALPSGDVPAGHIRDLSKVFAADKGIEIEIVELPYENLFEKAFNAGQTKSGFYDILAYDDSWAYSFMQPGFFEPLGPLYQKHLGTDGPDSDFIANAVALGRYPYSTGKVYGIPFAGYAQMFFYHPEEFRKAGLTSEPPFTWDEFYAAAKNITDEGGGRKFGYVIRGQQGDPIVSNFFPHLWAFGGSYYDENGDPNLDTPEALAALEFYLKLGEISPPGIASFDSDEMATYLLQGAALASINWPNWAVEYEDPASSKVVGEMAYTVLPHGTEVGQAYIGMWPISIFSASTNKDLAFEFIHWVTLAEQQKFGADKYGIPPTRLSVHNDPDLYTRSDLEWMPGLLQNVIYSRSVPRHHRWFEILESVGLFLSEAVAGVKTPEEALAASQQALIEINAKDE